MKKFTKALSVTLVSALMMTSFAACSKDEDKASESMSETKVETEAPKEDDSETTAAETTSDFSSDFRSGVDMVNVELISDEELDNAIDYMHYTNSFDENAAHVKFTFNEQISDFKFVKFNSDVDEDGTLTHDEPKMAYGYDDVDMELSIIITCDLPEVLPISGIIFTDADGNAHFLYLLVSGEDGHPFFQENLAEG